MRALPSILLLLLFTLNSQAQYGTFDAKAVSAAKANTTLVVLDDGDSPYNRTILDAVKAHWKFGSYDIIRASELATAPLSADRNYLLKTHKVDPDKYGATFLTLCKGWKQKKGEALVVENNAVTNLPAEHELAFLLIDPAAMAETNTSSFLNVYVKNLQDYLKQVENGKITDKTTADRLYTGRHRLMRDGLEIWMAAPHLDKSLPDAGAVKAVYQHDLQVKELAQLASAAAEGKSGVAITDVVLTGDHKNKWAFKRIFNANTGELMYQRDEAAVYGKKEGFLDEDLKTVERAR